MESTNGSDDVLQTLLVELARTEDVGPVHRTVLNACRVLRYLADRSVLSREAAGGWALTQWRPWDREDRELIEAALARETGIDKDAPMDYSAALVLGFRAEVIAMGIADPKDHQET